MEAKPSECRSSCANRGFAWGKSLHLFEQSGGCAARTACLFGGFAGTGVVPESDQCKNAFIEEDKSRCPVTRLHVQVTAAKRGEDNFRVADHSTATSGLA